MTKFIPITVFELVTECEIIFIHLILGFRVTIFHWVSLPHLLVIRVSTLYWTCEGVTSLSRCRGSLKSISLTAVNTQSTHKRIWIFTSHVIEKLNCHSHLIYLL